MPRNFDLLKLMSVEDLALFLCSMTYCQDCPHESKCENRDGYIKWLKEEAKEFHMSRLTENQNNTSPRGIPYYTLKYPVKSSCCDPCRHPSDCSECSLFQAVNKLGLLEEAMGDMTMDRAQEILRAGSDNKLFISDLTLGGIVYYIPKYNGAPYCEISAGHVQAISFTRAGVRVKIREYHPHNQDFMLGKTAFTTMEAATEAYESMLRGGDEKDVR